jgi:hypothetical protein
MIRVKEDNDNPTLADDYIIEFAKLLLSGGK